MKMRRMYKHNVTFGRVADLIICHRLGDSFSSFSLAKDKAARGKLGRHVELVVHIRFSSDFPRPLQHRLKRLEFSQP